MFDILPMLRAVGLRVDVSASCGLPGARKPPQRPKVRQCIGIGVLLGEDVVGKQVARHDLAASSRVAVPTCYQNLLIAIAGVTDAGALCPFGMIQTPSSAPALGLQLYSTAGAKPTSRLAAKVLLTSGPLGVSRPTTLVLPAKSASTSIASTHSLVRLYST